MATNVAPTTGPEPGAQIADGRFVLEEAIREAPYGMLYRGTDRTKGHPVSILCIASEIAALVPGSKKTIAAAQGVTHKNLCPIVELVSEAGNYYLVSDFLDGHPLRELLERKKKTGQPGFTPKGAGNIVSHLAAGLEALHQASAHGVICLDSVYVNKAGRVRLAFAGLAPLAPAAAKAGRFGEVVPPEVGSGQPATAQSDIYGVGAVVYEILTGGPPIKGCKRPSEVVPDTGALVDTFVATCMHPKPEQRPQSAAQLRTAIGKALASAPSKSQAQQAVKAPVSSRPSLAQAITAPTTGQMAAVSPGASNTGLQAALADDRENWLITKGKLDYGPFALQEVVEQIRGNIILPGHEVVDNSTGDRMPVEDHPLLTDLVDEARQKRDDARRAQAEVASVKQEKRRGTALYGFIAMVVAVVGLAAYFLITKLGSDSDSDKAEIASLEESSLEAKISFPSAEERKKRARARKKRRGKSGSAAEADGTSGGWDDTLDLDMEGSGGGSERLDDSEINPVIQQHGRKLGRCLTSTGSRSASIDFIVLGTGKVSQVRVNGQTSGPLANCLRKAMMSMKFRSFNGPRTKATFDMAL